MDYVGDVRVLGGFDMHIVYLVEFG